MYSHRRHSYLLLGYAGGLLVLVFLFMTVPTPAQAQRQATSTRTPTRTLTPTITPTPTTTPIAKVSWRSTGSDRLPSRLSDTASIGPGGGGGGWGYPWLCENVSDDVWIASANVLQPVYYNGEFTIDFITGNEEDFYAFIPEYHIQYCGNSLDTNSWAYLVGPDGLQRPMTNYAEEKRFYYEFTDADPDGKYDVTIVTSNGTLTGQVLLQRKDYIHDVYSGPLVFLRDPNNGSEAVSFQPGQSIHLQFMRGQPRTQAVVGLYQLMGSGLMGSELVLLNSWPVQFNRAGEYEMILEIPRDAVPGQYSIYLTDSDKPIGEYINPVQPAKDGPQMPIGGAAGYSFSLWKPEASISGPESVVASFYNSLNGAIKGEDISTLEGFMSKQLLASGFLDQFLPKMSVVSSIGLEGVSLDNSTTDEASVQVRVLQLEEAVSGKQRSHLDVTWDLVYEDGGWKLDRVAGYDETPLSPVNVTLGFYHALGQALTTGDYHIAYSLLSRNRKQLRTYDGLKALYEHTISIEIESIELVDENETQATVHVVVGTSEWTKEALEHPRYDITYSLVKEDGTWHMDTPVIKQLGN
ncbi:MAG: hypothetical protein U0X20_29330 [Caldilineaceae bacterium]